MAGKIGWIVAYSGEPDRQCVEALCIVDVRNGRTFAILTFVGARPTFDHILAKRTLDYNGW